MRGDLLYHWEPGAMLRAVQLQKEPYALVAFVEENHVTVGLADY